jgi:hypothetical protein
MQIEDELTDFHPWYCLAIRGQNTFLELMTDATDNNLFFEVSGNFGRPRTTAFPTAFRGGARLGVKQMTRRSVRYNQAQTNRSC